MRTTMTIKVTRGKFKGEVIVLNANAEVPAKFSPFKVIEGSHISPVKAVKAAKAVEVEEVVEEATEPEATEPEATEPEDA